MSEVYVDSTSVRAYRSVGPKKSLDGEPFDHALGVSRGGFGSKIHLDCDKRGIPLAVKITAGQVHDSTQLENVLEEIHIPRVGKGRPKCKPARVAADKAYSCTRIRRYLISRAIKSVIPRKSNEPDGRERFDIGTYKNLVPTAVSIRGIVGMVFIAVASHSNQSKVPKNYTESERKHADPHSSERLELLRSLQERGYISADKLDEIK